MPAIMVTGADRIKAQLTARTPKGRRQMTVRVGYVAPYAIKQHEDTTLNHPNGGQAKFLEQPAREHRQKMRDLVKDSMLTDKKGLEYALTRAGEFLLERSQLLVPVDTGFLKESGSVDVR
jgi:hypothetical protein